jgi:hypothetical protein
MQFVAGGLGVAIVLSAMAKPFKETGDGVALRIGGRDDGLPAWRISFFRRMKRKRFTGMGIVDLFLAMLPDHLPHCGVPDSEHHLCWGIIPGKWDSS